jgi:hypothetical protein
MHGFPKRYVVFDTETKTETREHLVKTQILTFRLGVSCTVDYWTYANNLPHYTNLHTPLEFHEHLRKLTRYKEPIWVFAHNAGFDIRIIEMFSYLTNGWYDFWNPSIPEERRYKQEPTLIMENPPLIIRTYRPDGQQILWIDTFQWIAHSLRKVGDIMKYPKMEMPKEDSSIEEWFTYCRRDVEVLYMALRKIWKWLDSEGVKTFMPTRAGQAMQIFDQLYDGSKIIRHDNQKASMLERQGYYGGRTDLWHVGTVKGPIYQLDVNSLYPYVMQQNLYPHELVEHLEWDGKRSLPIPADGECCTAEVLLQTSTHTYPVRNKKGTYFCKGKVRTVLAGPELVQAIQRGHVKKVLRLNRYRLANLFEGFITHYWESRRKAQIEGDDVANWIIKLLMNSLYGKFGQKTGEWVYHDPGGLKGEYGQGWVAGGGIPEDTSYQVIDGKVFYRCERDEARKAFVAIASFTTAYARQYMETLKEMMGSGTYYYQATDSLYVDNEGYNTFKDKGMIDSSKLGSLKLEDTYETLTFRNIHNLDKDGKEVRGSIRWNAIKIDDNTYRVETWESFKCSVLLCHINEVRIKEMIKVLNPVYHRQIVNDDGSVEPYTIDNWGVTVKDQTRLSVT